MSHIEDTRKNFQDDSKTKVFAARDVRKELEARRKDLEGGGRITDPMIHRDIEQLEAKLAKATRDAQVAVERAAKYNKLHPE